MALRRLVQHGSVLAMLVALLALTAVGASTLPAASAVAQDRPPVLTTVSADGALRYLDGDNWITLPQNVGPGTTVTGIAWHPVNAEVLLVRRTFTRTDPPEPSYALVYLDLVSGQEQTILEGVGPEASIVGPQIAPGGQSGFARLECCLSPEVVSFSLPLTGEPPKRTPAGAFLDEPTREVSLVTAGAYGPRGQILMTVECCTGDEPPSDLRGLYLVSPDLQSAEKLAPAVQGVPIGMSMGSGWAAVLEPPAPAPDEGPDDGWSLVLVDLETGQRRPPLGEGGMRLAPVGAVSTSGPNGSIAVASQAPGDDLWQPLGRLFRVGLDDREIIPVPEHEGGGVTAFAWASQEAVAGALHPAGASPVASSPETPPSASEVPHEVQVFFSRHPESDADFSAVFPVTRTVGDAGVAHGALEALLRGPTPEEQAAGYYSELGGMLVGPSDCNGQPFTLRIQDGTATLRFCQLVTSAGIGQDARVISAIEATLRQFPTIQHVRILTREGDCLFDMSGENRCLATP